MRLYFCLLCIFISAFSAHQAIVFRCLSTPQIAGGYPDTIARTCQLIEETCSTVDFVDINCGCPIDLVSALIASSEGPQSWMHQLMGEEKKKKRTPILDAPTYGKRKKKKNTGSEDLLSQMKEEGPLVKKSFPPTCRK